MKQGDAAFFRGGFSLLEIVLSLAILAGALAALGEVMRMGDQNAELARDESQAGMLAESVMAELACGARPLTAVNGAAFDLAVEPPWEYSIAVEATEYSELVAVRVSVAQQLVAEMQPARCTLIRWMLNPDFVTAQINAQETATAETNSRSTSGTGSGAGNGQADGENEGNGFGGGGGRGGGGP